MNENNYSEQIYDNINCHFMSDEVLNKYKKELQERLMHKNMELKDFSKSRFTIKFLEKDNSETNKYLQKLFNYFNDKYILILKFPLCQIKEYDPTTIKTFNECFKFEVVENG